MDWYEYDDYDDYDDADEEPFDPESYKAVSVSDNVTLVSLFIIL